MPLSLNPILPLVPHPAPDLDLREDLIILHTTNRVAMCIRILQIRGIALGPRT